MYGRELKTRVAATANLIGESGERLTSRSPFLLAYSIIGTFTPFSFAKLFASS